MAQQQRIGARWLEAVRKAFRLGPAVVGEGAGSFMSQTGFYSYDPGYVAPEKWMELSVGVYACIRLRAQTLASVPLVVYRQGPDGLVAVPDHPLAQLLAGVNPHWTPVRLWQMTESSLCTWGEAFWVLERGQSGKGQPTEIWYARADKMKPIPDPQGYLRGFVYEDGNRKLEFAPGEVIWFRYPNPADEFRGLSPLEAARVSVEASVDAMRSNANIFRNGMSPGGILSPEDNSVSFTREERELLEAQLAKRMTGADRRHRMMVFSHKVNISTPTLSPKEAEFMALMGWTLNDVCRVYQVPPTKVQDFSRATYNNVSEADKALWTDAILPELAMLASELTEQLAPMFGDGLVVDFDTASIRALQEDQTEITDQMVKLANLGVPLNTLLQAYRPDLLPEGGTGYSWGDVPLAWQIPGAAPAPAAPPAMQAEGDAQPVQEVATRAYPFVQAVPAYGSTRHKAELRSRDALVRQYEQGMAAAYMAWADALTADIVGRLTSGAKALGTGPDDLDPDDPFDLVAWQQQALEGMGPFIEQAAQRGGTVAANRINSAVRFNIGSPAARRFLRERQQRFVEEITESRWQALKVSLQAGINAGEDTLQLAERVPQHVRPIRSSAETIARTEVVGAFNGGTELAYRESGVVAQKVWLAALDDRTRDTHRDMHGQTVDVGDDFTSPDGARGPAPGQLGEAAEDINCRCTTIAVLGPAAGADAGNLAGVEAERAEAEGF
jgi:HK97 family phage portal protein